MSATASSAPRQGAAGKPATGRRILEVAQEIFGQVPRPSWVTFFREVLGLEGIVRHSFTRPQELAAFEATPQYAELERMLARLRAHDDDGGPREPQRVITVRLPKTLHETLKAEAHEQYTSLNKLAISRLLRLSEPPAV